MPRTFMGICKFLPIHTFQIPMQLTVNVNFARNNYGNTHVLTLNLFIQSGFLNPIKACYAY